jgi:tape measure domain-containing protein
VSEEDSFRLLSAAGNANALAGGGRDELQRILRAFSQIATNGAILGEELNQLSEAGIAAKAMLKDRFGTADGGELARMGVTGEDGIRALIEEMEKLPKATGGAKNSLENLAMAADMAVVGVGTGLNNRLIPELDKFGAVLERLNEEGAFEALGSVLGDIALTVFPQLEDGSIALYDTFVDLAVMVADAGAALATIPKIIKEIFDSGFDILDYLAPGLGTMNKDILEWMTSELAGGSATGAGETLRRRITENARKDGRYGPQLPGGWKSEEEKAAELAAKAIEESAKAGDDKANMHLQGIEKNTKIMADGFNSFFGTSTLGSNYANARNLGMINGSTVMSQQQTAFAVVSGISALSQAQLARRR